MSTTLHPDWLDWPQTRKLVTAFAKKKAELRFVGGAVRDALLGRAVQDVDAATPLPPDAVIALLDKARIKTIPTGLAHGTVTALIDGKHFEITTLRQDIACDGRHAEVAFTDDWQADAARRDFTMNALYLSPVGELYDYFDGAQDAQAGRVRFIGEPAARITEDYLRILRFFRFHAHYGKEPPDEEALAACAALASHMETLSGERIQAELLKLLAAAQPSPTLSLMQELRLFPLLLGFEIRDVAIFARLEALQALTGITLEPFILLSGFIFSIGAHLVKEDALEMLAERLRLSAQMAREINIIIRHYKLIQPRLDEAAQKRALRRLGPVHFKRTVLLSWAYGKEPMLADHPYSELLTLADQWQAPEFPINGKHLIKLGVDPGKAMGELLQALEEEWEAADYTLTREELLEKARHLM